MARLYRHFTHKLHKRKITVSLLVLFVHDGVTNLLQLLHSLKVLLRLLGIGGHDLDLQCISLIKLTDLVEYSHSVANLIKGMLFQRRQCNKSY